MSIWCNKIVNFGYGVFLSLFVVSTVYFSMTYDTTCWVNSYNITAGNCSNNTCVSLNNTQNTNATTCWNADVLEYYIYNNAITYYNVSLNNFCSYNLTMNNIQSRNNAPCSFTFTGNNSVELMNMLPSIIMWVISIIVLIVTFVTGYFVYRNDSRIQQYRSEQSYLLSGTN